MKKALIVLTLAFVIAAPSYAAAQNVETGDFSAQVKSFLGEVFQGSSDTSGEISGDSDTISIPTPVPNQVNLNEKFNLRSGEEMKLAGTPITVKFLHLIETREIGGDIYAQLQIEEDQGNASTARETGIKSGESEVVYKDYALTYLSGYEFVFEKADRGDTSPINKICCKIYGHGDRMKKVNVHYEWMPKEKCSIPENFVGGNREVVDNEYCMRDRGKTAPAPSPGDSAPTEYDRGKTAPAPRPGEEEPVEVERGETAPAETEGSEETGRGMIERVKNFFKRATPRGEEAPTGPGKFSPAEESDVSQEVRRKVEQKREKVREEIREHRQEVESIRQEAMRKVEERRREFSQEIQAIRNQEKRALAERIHDKLFGIRENTLENFNGTLEQLNSVTGNITTRAEKSAAEGVSTEQVENTVNNAESKINSARQAVKNVFQKDYAVQNASDLQALRNEFRSFRDELKNDLLDARNMVREAHRATRSAAEELTQTIESE